MLYMVFVKRNPGDDFVLLDMVASIYEALWLAGNPMWFDSRIRACE